MLFERMTRAATIDATLYEEVEHDPAATTQAATVVGLVAMAQLLGHLASVLPGDTLARAFGGPGTPDTSAAVLWAVVNLTTFIIGWVVWSYLTYFIGTTFFKGTATLGEVLRTLGFAATPGLLGLFAFIPCLGTLAWLAGGVLMLVAGVIAIRQALDIPTDKAIVTVMVSAIPYLILLSLTYGVVLIGVSLLPPS